MKRANKYVYLWVIQGNYGYGWEDENVNSLKAFIDMISREVTVTDWSAGGRGEGVSFRVEDGDIENLTGARLMAFLWNNYGATMYPGKYYGKLSETHPDGTKIEKNDMHPNGTRHVKRYSGATRQGWNGCLTGYCMDDSVLRPMYEAMEGKRMNATFHGIIEDCFSECLKAFNDDREWQDSDEYLKEQIESNEYEYKEDGTRY